MSGELNGEINSCFINSSLCGPINNAWSPVDEGAIHFELVGFDSMAFGIPFVIPYGVEGFVVGDIICVPAEQKMIYVPGKSDNYDVDVPPPDTVSHPEEEPDVLIADRRNHKCS